MRTHSMHPMADNSLQLTRRHFFGRTATGLGVRRWHRCWASRRRGERAESSGGLPGLPHFAPKAKRVIYLFQSGAPSQIDLFDYKPQLADLRATRNCPTRFVAGSG